LLGGSVGLESDRILSVFVPVFPEGSKYAGGGIVFMICLGGIILNVVLNILNLAPIYPLDGGQIARQFMVKLDPYNGIRNSIVLSLGTAVLIAVVSLSYGDRFLAFFFAFMAWTNYQMLQQYNGPRW
jgi:Zn-dependent protease